MPLAPTLQRALPPHRRCLRNIRHNYSRHSAYSRECGFDERTFAACYAINEYGPRDAIGQPPQWVFAWVFARGGVSIRLGCRFADACPPI